jgi:hypothetical protein
MKVAIQGLGEIPKTIELVLKKEKPDVTYIICSDYQLKHVASDVGYKKPNKEIIEDVAKKTKTEVKFQKCDVFRPKSVSKAIRQVLGQIDQDNDKVIVNYTGGSALVRVLLGATGVVLSSIMDARLVYAIKYPKGLSVQENHTKMLRDIFPDDLQVLFSLKKGKDLEV